MGGKEFKNDIISIINDRQQISYNELSDMAFSRGIDEKSLKGALSELENVKTIASRSNGGILTYYSLQDENALRKVLIVEDDKNINKLMAISIGKGFEVRQIYDGGEAIGAVREDRPDLVILDLMLPHKDGLDICRTIKTDSNLNNTIVILISAMDPTSNRFKGIQYGADYYIKKPFDPHDLRTLVTLFLKKKGKRFDPLIDLPDEERISKEIEHSIKESAGYVIGTLKIGSLSEYARRFGEKPALVILRLVSQLLQDSIKQNSENTFVGFLNSDDFMVAGARASVDSLVKEVKEEFAAVIPFILQDAGFKNTVLDIDAIFESEDVPKLSIEYKELDRDDIEQRRNEVLKDKGAKKPSEIGAYTYDELQKIVGKDALDIIITRDSSGVRLRVGKSMQKEEEE
ncbi:MAG: response regulator transcription factor [Candidatus Marsarchaeota archaeon]|nr:response regulator transcription factor [Candidatus Marsarchaeota archaeon]